MLSLTEQAITELRGFLHQRTDLIQVLDAADGDLPAALKMLEGLNVELGWVWGWVFAQPFADPLTYVGAIVQEIGATRAAIGAALQQQGKPSLPELPAALQDAEREPADRLRSVVVYLRSLMPRMPGAVTLFCLAPLAIADPEAYGSLASELVRHQLPFPWCAGVRFILRDDPARPALQQLAAAPRTRSLRVDFGPDALAAAARREATDERLPIERRMTAAIVAAGMDQAYGRTADALTHYDSALKYYGETGNPAMAAIAANGIAACRQAEGDLAAAERVMHAALETGLQADPPALPVVLNILLDLTMLVARQHRWAEAELYLTATDAVAGALFMPGERAEALDRRGITQMRLGKQAEAEASWRAAIRIADEADAGEHAMAARTHLAWFLKKTGRGDEAREIAREIAQTERADPAASACAHGEHQ
jgi:tetratricopeptide (TPR) repeat protein